MSALVNLTRHFPVVVRQHVEWGAMDAYQHVNNVNYFRYFENARLKYFSEIASDELVDAELRKHFINGTGIGPILANTDCKYKFPLTFPDSISIGCRADHISKAGFTMIYRVVSETHNRIAAEGTGKIVSYDYGLGKRADLPESVLEAVYRLEKKCSGEASSKL